MCPRAFDADELIRDVVQTNPRFPVVPLRPEPKQGKHLWWGQDLGLARRRNGRGAAETRSGGLIQPRHGGVFGGFGSGGEGAGLEPELMPKFGAV